MKKYDTTPKKDGFRMPGEFEPHTGSWMLWPQRPDTWRMGGKPAQQAFAEVAKAIRRFEPLTVGVNEDQYENAINLLPSDIRVVEMSSDDAWMRDTGPTFVVNNETSEVRGVDWKFNSWGGLVYGVYFPWKLDDQIARKVCDMEYKSRYRLEHVVIEGGAVNPDGDGTILTTEECLLAEGRNPDLSKEELTEVLLNYLGADKVIWLRQGMYLDEKNGHVDNMCRFFRPGGVLLSWTDDTEDPQYEISRQSLEILENETDAKGRQLEVVKIPLPAPMYRTAEEAAGIDIIPGIMPRSEGARLPASYTNFYCVNGGIIVPQFGSEQDAQAMDIIAQCFPGREIVPVYARELILGGGCIHSITLPQPAPPEKPKPPVPDEKTAAVPKPESIGEETGSSNSERSAQ